MNKGYIFGSGGHARVIKSIIENEFDVEFVGIELEKEIFSNISLFKDATFFIGIGQNSVRDRIFNRCQKFGLKLGNCIASNAFVDKDVSLGIGVFVGYGASVLVGSVIGDNVIINTKSSVDHDCKIDNGTQITANVTLGGGVTIGRSCFIGISAVVLPGVNIKDFVNVMASSVVSKSFDSRDITIGGAPARRIK